MYRAHDIEINKEDRHAAYGIIAEHLRLGNIDDLRIYEDTVRGVKTLTFHIHPYVYEDFEKIRDEFINAGIRIM